MAETFMTSGVARLSPLQRDRLELASALLARGELACATETIEWLRQSAPHSLPVAILAAQAMLRQDRYRDAHQLVMQIAVPPIHAPEDLLRVAGLLQRLEEPQALERLVMGSDWRKARSPALLLHLAQCLGFSGLLALAFQCLDQALDMEPGNADALYLQGLFELFAGNADKSDKSIKRALAIQPHMATAHWLQSMQDDAESAAPHVVKLQQVMSAAAPGSEARAYFDYALHHSLDKLGRHQEAWQALAYGHTAMRRLRQYDSRAQHALVGALERTSLPVFETATPAGPSGLIFIVGMFRSGTTLIERVLAGHPDVVDGGETYQLSACLRQATDHGGDEAVDATIVARSPHADFDQVRRRMLAYAEWRASGRRWLTEKLPSNFLNIGFILHAFPEARILHMRRDPLQTCFSNLRTIFRGAAPYACDQLALADYYLSYHRLMTHWRRLAPDRILDVDYADFIDDPEGQARRILAHCDLDFAPGTLDLGRSGGTTATASAAHVRRGILRDRDAAWKPYATQLQPLIRALRAGGIEVPASA